MASRWCCFSRKHINTCIIIIIYCEFFSLTLILYMFILAFLSAGTVYIPSESKRWQVAVWYRAVNLQALTWMTLLYTLRTLSKTHSTLSNQNQPLVDEVVSAAIGSAAGEEQWQEEDQSSRRFANILHRFLNVQLTQQVAFQVSAEFQFLKFKPCAKKKRKITDPHFSCFYPWMQHPRVHECMNVPLHFQSRLSRPAATRRIGHSEVLVWSCIRRPRAAAVSQSSELLMSWAAVVPREVEKKRGCFAWQAAGFACGFLHTTPTSVISVAATLLKTGFLVADFVQPQQQLHSYDFALK